MSSPKPDLAQACIDAVAALKKADDARQVAFTAATVATQALRQASGDGVGVVAGKFIVMAAAGQSLPIVIPMA